MEKLQAILTNLGKDLAEYRLESSASGYPWKLAKLETKIEIYKRYCIHGFKFRDLNFNEILKFIDEMADVIIRMNIFFNKSPLDEINTKILEEDAKKKIYEKIVKEREK